MTPEEAKRFEENEQIQYVVKRFQEAMGKFDSVHSSINSTLSDIKSISEQFIVLKNKCDSIFMSLEALKKQVTDQNTIVDSHSISLASIMPIVKDVTQHKAEIGDIQGQNASIRGQVTNLKNSIENCASSAQFSDLKIAIKNNLDEMRSKFQDNVQKISDFTNKSDSHMQFSQSLSQDMANLSNNHDRLALDMKNLASDIGLGKVYTESSLSDMQQKLLNYINDSIASIPKSAIPNLEDAKKVMDDKLIPSALDAKNANLRSTNNEHKILILEKKIEQLQLLLNKLQIQG